MKKAAIGLIATAVSLLCAVALVETALRVSIAKLPLPFLVYLNPEVKDRAPAAWRTLLEKLPTVNQRQEDRDVGWVFKPNIERREVNEDGEPYVARTSAEGFYTPDQPSPSTPQLITVGASFLATYYVTHPVQNVLREELHVPVYNLAIGGWGPESYRAAYEKFGGGRTHDLVVVVTVPSDPSNVLYWNAWKGDEGSESFMRFMQKATAADGTINRDTSWPDTHLVSWNLVRFAARRPAASGSSGGGADGDDGGGSSGITKLEHFGTGPHAFDLRLLRPQVFLAHDPDYFMPGSTYYPVMQQYFESLLRMKAAIEARHARMVLVWAPSKERVYVPFLPAARQTEYVTNGTHDVSGLEKVLARFAAAEGLTYLDLTPLLNEHARRGEKLFFTVDGHWNSHGNEVVGKALAEFIKTMGNPPAPVVAGPPLYIRRGPVAIERPLTAASMTYHADIVRPGASGWRASGRAEGPFSYLAMWPEVEVSAPEWLLATGVVHRGGVTFGLLDKVQNKWVLQFTVPSGRFDIALPVVAGRYQPIVSNTLREGSLENDVEVTSLGWAPIK